MIRVGVSDRHHLRHVGLRLERVRRELERGHVVDALLGLALRVLLLELVLGGVLVRVRVRVRGRVRVRVRVMVRVSMAWNMTELVSGRVLAPPEQHHLPVDVVLVRVRVRARVRVRVRGRVS